MVEKIVKTDAEKADANSRIIRGHSREGDGARFHRQVLEQSRKGNLPVRLL